MQFPLPPTLSHDSTLLTDEQQQTMAHKECNGTGNGFAIGQALSTTAKSRTDVASYDHDHDPNLNQPPSLSFAARAAQMTRTPTPLLVHGDDRLLRDITRGPPGDPSPQQRLRRQASASLLDWAGGKRSEDRDLVRRRSRHFENAFAAWRPHDERQGNGQDGDGVTATAPVLVEVRTNVVVADELAVITALAAHVAARYRRPAASVAIALQHSACLCVGGSFAPAYELAVHALPVELQPATNRRNTALLQRHLAAVLGVPPARGLLRFVPVPATNLAYNGRTVAGHMEAAEGGGGDDADDNGNGFFDDDQPEHKSHRMLSVKSLSSFRSSASRTPRPSHASDRATPPRSRSSSSATAAAAGGGGDDPPPQLPAIPERVLKESLRGSSGEDNQEARAAVVTEQEPSSTLMAPSAYSGPSAPSSAPSSPAPATPPSTDIQTNSSGRRRVQRTKSFVATLFGRAGGNGNGSSNGVDSRSSSA